MKKIFAICSLLIAICATAHGAGVQEAWDNPNANMAAGSIKPGYAQLTWAAGTVLPIKLRNGMVTMVNLPSGEIVADGVVGNDGMFDFTAEGGSLYITPKTGNQGGDTNLIVTGKSGNRYIFYLRSEPANSSEITYSQVDVVLGDNSALPAAIATTAGGGSMNSIMKKAPTNTTLGVDGEDYGWIKSMKIDPSEFRFDLDIFVPNPDDYVIAPERVWRDRIFTYIDFGDKVIAMTQRPVVSLLVEGGESPVGFRTDGDNGRLLIVEAVGDMVLRSGQRIVCIKKRDKPFLIADTNSVMALAEANVAQSIASTQSLNNSAYLGGGLGVSTGVGGGYNVMPTTVPMNYGTVYGGIPTQTTNTSTTMIPTARNTTGSYLPNSNIPLISSNQAGVAVELRSDSSVKALNDYWTSMLARFAGDDGAGLLTPYKNMVFFAVDEQGVGDLGSDNSAGRLYRLRIGPMADIDTAQKLCDQMLRVSDTSCNVVRVQ